jgi:hypothetical protein
MKVVHHYFISDGNEHIHDAALTVTGIYKTIQCGFFYPALVDGGFFCKPYQGM